MRFICLFVVCLIVATAAYAFLKSTSGQGVPPKSLCFGRAICPRKSFTKLIVMYPSLSRGCANFVGNSSIPKCLLVQLADPEGWYKELRERALMIMIRTIMQSVLCLAVGFFLIAVDVVALAQSPPGNLSPKDFDLACAVAAAADIGVSQNEQNIPRRDVAVRMFIFYLGRLSGRDDSKDWNAIAWGRVAELPQQARSSEILDRCLGLYNSKTK
jgi:hypothetical protein